MQVEYWTGRGGSTLHLHHKHMVLLNFFSNFYTQIYHLLKGEGFVVLYDGGELGSTDRDRQVENCGLTA